MCVCVFVSGNGCQPCACVCTKHKSQAGETEQYTEATTTPKIPSLTRPEWKYSTVCCAPVLLLFYWNGCVRALPVDLFQRNCVTPSNQHAGPRHDSQLFRIYIFSLLLRLIRPTFLLGLMFSHVVSIYLYNLWPSSDPKSTKACSASLAPSSPYPVCVSIVVVMYSTV